MTHEDLDLMQTDDLIDALKRRYEHLALVAKHVTSADGKVCDMQFCFNGDVFTCVGIIESLRLLSLRNLKAFLEQPHTGRSDDEGGVP